MIDEKEQRRIWDRMNEITKASFLQWRKDMDTLFPGLSPDEQDERWEEETIKFLNYEGQHPGEPPVKNSDFQDDDEDVEGMEWTKDL